MTDNPDKKDPDATRTGVHRMLPVGTVLADRYELLDLVGAGGMGMVYRAHDRRLDLEVALKVLSPEKSTERETVERFERELILARQVSHPNVVRIHDIGQDGDVHFLTMDFVAGRSLKELLEEEGAMPVDQAVGVARDLARGLRAAHEKSVIHRDLKPANVLIDESGRARITDFGVARSLSTPGPTRPGNVLGTPYYLSPEQALGESVDGRSDLYALGLLIHEMLSGRLPFNAESFEESLAQRISGSPRTLGDSVDNAPRWLDAVVSRCLRRDPDERYADAGELLSDLESHVATRGARRIRGWLAGAAVVILLLALGLGLYRFGGLRESAPAGQAPSGEAAEQASESLTVAVLPFVDETGRPTLGWVRTGVAEMISVSLAEIPSLQVVDSLRVFRTLEDLGLEPVRLSDSEIAQITSLLDAGRLVSGRVRSAGDSVQLEASLIGTADSAQPSERFTARAEKPADILEAVESLSGQLRGVFEADPAPAGEAALAATPQALAAYGEGVRMLSRGDSLGAIGALEEAVASDQAFAAGWMRLANAYQNAGYWEKAADAAERAVSHLGESQGRIALEARALSASLTGEMDRALELRKRLVEQFPNDIEAMVALGELQGDTGQLDAARATLEDVVRRDPNHPRAWYLLGKFSILAGRSRAAIDDYLVRALVIQNRLDNAQGKADVLNAMGIAYAQISELQEAQDHYARAAELRRQIGDQRGVAATLSNLAKIQRLRGDFDGARDRMREAMEIHRDIGDRQGVAFLQNEFGLLEEETGNYEEALNHYRDALRIREELGLGRELSESYNNVGYTYYLLGEYDNAAVYARQALERYQETDNRDGVMLVRQTIGLLETARGNWDAALSAALSSLEISRELEIHGASAVSLGVLARVAWRNGRYSAALDSYGEALALVESIDNPRGRIEYLLARAAVMLDLNDVKGADAGLESAQELLDQNANREQAADLARLKALLLLASGGTEDAAAAIEPAGAKAQSSGSVVASMEMDLARGRIALESGDLGEAEAIFDAVHGQASSIGHAVLQLEALEYRARTALQLGELTSAADALKRAIELVEKHEPYGRAWRLHLLEARRRMASGEEDAPAALSNAAEEFSRVQANVPSAMMEGFRAQPEVKYLNERYPVSKP